MAADAATRQPGARVKKHGPSHRQGSKAKAQTRHALRRADERFGLKLTKQQLAEYVQDIHVGRARCLEKQSNRVGIFLVRGQRVVYDKERKTIVSFLPPATE